MITSDQQRIIIDGVKALTVGLDAQTKRDRQQTLMIGVVLALNAVDVTLLPPTWHLAVMNQRVEKVLTSK